MKTKLNPGKDIVFKLTSSGHLPYAFEVTIQEPDSQNQFGYQVQVTGPNPQTDSSNTHTYQLPDKTHVAYINFYEQLAQDFGLRLPLNRQPQKDKPDTAIPYREILTRNLTPEIRYGYGDPAVLRVEATADTGPWYYLVATTNDAPHAFPILRSRNLANWQFVSFVFPPGQKPAWAADGELVSDYWAPEMHQVGNEFRLYFVARDKHSRELCIGLAKAASPGGPFQPETEPILRGNIIDPHVFVPKNGDAYLYWKEDNNDIWPGELITLLDIAPQLITELFPQTEDQRTVSFILTIWPWARQLEPMERFQAIQVFIESVTVRYLDFYNQLSGLLSIQPVPVQEQIRRVHHFMKTPMFAQLLSPDGTQLLGERTKVLENDLAWEAHLVEGMWVTEQAGRYYLFYAGNDFSTDHYGIGVAIGDSPLGPFRKVEQPLLQSTPAWWAPGHPSVALGPDGTPLLFLHAYFPGKAGYKQFRALLAVGLRFEEDRVVVIPPPCLS